jgi:hypothetical protein
MIAQGIANGVQVLVGNDAQGHLRLHQAWDHGCIYMQVQVGKTEQKDLSKTDI